MTQNEWMTSRDCSRILTDLSTGRYSVGSFVLVDVAVGGRLRLHAHRPDGVSAVLVFAVVLEVPRPLLADRDDRHVGVFGTASRGSSGHAR